MKDMHINMDLKVEAGKLTATIKDANHTISFSIDNLEKIDDSFHDYLDASTSLIKQFAPKQ